MLKTIAKRNYKSNSELHVAQDSNLLLNSYMENKEIRRARMLEILKRFNDNVAEMGRAMNYDDANYLRTIKRGERDMGDELARKFEAAFSLAEGWMDLPPSQREIEEQGAPVVGTAQLGDQGYYDENRYPVGHGTGFVRYPMRDPNTYALRCRGDSMRPRIQPGEFVVIEPNRAVAPGDEVMVQTRDGRSMIKKLGSHRDGQIELLSVNEDFHPITIDESDVAKIHYVGGIFKASMYYERS